MEERTKYSVVIVTYNRCELLKKCIDHVLGQSLSFDEIMIVDNHSEDGTKAYLKDICKRHEAGEEQKKGQKLHVIRTAKNLGGAGGFHLGIKQVMKSDTDWVLLIDDDAMLEADYLEKLHAFIQKNKDVNACSGTVMTEGVIDVSHRRKIGNRLLFLEQPVAKEQYRKDAFHYNFSTFCGLMVKKSVIWQIGLPKKEYFIWYDDTEYSMRLAEYGGIWNVNDAVLNHETILTTGKGNFLERLNWKSYYGYRNRFDTISSHGTKVQIGAVYLQFYLFMLLALLNGIRKNDIKQGVEHAKLFFCAMKDGVSGRLGKNEKFTAHVKDVE